MRGSASDSSRSQNSHIRSPRRVTWTPMGMPSRSLNCAIDLRARATAGFWPVMTVRSRTAPSISLASLADAHVDHDLGQPGNLHGVGVAELFPECRDDLGAVPLLQPRHRGRGCCLGRCCHPLFLSEILAAGPGNPDLPACVIAAEACPGRLLAVRVDQRHVADMDGGLLVDDAALLGAPPPLIVHLGVLLDHVHALHQQALLVRVDRDDRALPALVTAGDDDHAIALPDLHQSTSGASEMIRMNRFSRSSRPTGPKIRVPRGSPPSLISTAAFSSKRM